MKNIGLYLFLFSKKIFKKEKIAKVKKSNWKDSLNIMLVKIIAEGQKENKSKIIFLLVLSILSILTIFNTITADINHPNIEIKDPKKTESKEILYINPKKDAYIQPVL